MVNEARHTRRAFVRAWRRLYNIAHYARPIRRARPMPRPPSPSQLPLNGAVERERQQQARTERAILAFAELEAAQEREQGEAEVHRLEAELQNKLLRESSTLNRTSLDAEMADRSASARRCAEQRAQKILTDSQTEVSAHRHQRLRRDELQDEREIDEYHCQLQAFDAEQAARTERRARVENELAHLRKRASVTPRSACQHKHSCWTNDRNRANKCCSATSSTCVRGNCNCSPWIA